MNPWLRFYEAITKPLPVASSLFLAVSTGFILFGPTPILTKLGASHVITDYRWAVGLGFVIATAWLVVTALIALCRIIHTATMRRFDIHRAKHDVQKYISLMTPKEREIIGYLLAKNQRMFTYKLDGGYASTLISRNIIRCALQHRQMLFSNTGIED